MRAFDPIRQHSARHAVAPDVTRALSTYRSLVADAAEVVGDVAEVEPTASLRWEGPITFEGQITGDGRLIENGALTWPDDLSEANPLPFRTVFEDIGFHDNAFVTGHIFGIERRAGGVIWAWGDYDRASEHGVEAHRLMIEKLSDGVSVDLDDIAFEVRVRSELLEQVEGVEEEVILAAAGDSPDAADYEVVWEGKPDDEIMVTTAARIRSATQVAIPAFANARIAAVAEAPAEEAPAEEAPAAGEAEVETQDDAALVAAAAPVNPPREWFSDPKLDGPTPIRIDENGRLSGHLATWDVCHVASPGGAGVCVTAPHSEMNYARFHLGSLLTAEGEAISVGKITMGTGHAGPNASPQQTVAHYDNTGTAVADVRAGEDEYGIWVAGAVRPGITDDQLRALRASPLSGDWRRVDGNLELHGALAVNVPGFPVIPRPGGLVASGELYALTAAALVVTEESAPGAFTGELQGLSPEDIGYLQRLAQRERNADREARRLAVHAFAARRRVTEFAAQRRANREDA